jgi:hypothetical protein
VARTRPKLRRLSHSESLEHTEAVKLIVHNIGEKYRGQVLDYETQKKITTQINNETLEYFKDKGLIHENGAFYVEEEEY